MEEIKIQTEAPDLLGFPGPAQWNYMNISKNVPLDSLQMNSNLVRDLMKTKINIWIKFIENVLFTSLF